MKKNKNIYNTKNKAIKKDWTYYLVLGCLLFTFIGSALGTVAFFKTLRTRTVTASASEYVQPYDSNTTDNDSFHSEKKFTASNFLIPLVRYSYTTENAYQYNSTIVNFFNFEFIMEYNDYFDNGEADSYNFRLNLTPHDNSETRYYINYQQYIDGVYTDNLNHLMPFISGNAVDYDNYNRVLYSLRFGSRSSSNKYQAYLIINYKLNNEYELLNNPITRIDLGSKQVNWSDQLTRYLISDHFDGADGNGTTLRENFYFNTIKYYQGTFLAFEFGFLTYNTSTTNNLFENRSYYTLNGVEGKSDYQLGYDNGVIDGVQQGIESGTDDAFDRGKLVGKQEGFNDGYEKGIEDAGTNNFRSLFGAIIDAPISALRGLLNFEILGFNIFNFLTALLTVSLIIFVVRLFI